MMSVNLYVWKMMIPRKYALTLSTLNIGYFIQAYNMYYFCCLHAPC